MKKLKFIKMLEIVDNEEEMNKLNVDDVFLYGASTIAQKQNKLVGDSITYYKVIDKKPNGIEYTPIFDYLERDKGEEL